MMKKWLLSFFMAFPLTGVVIRTIKEGNELFFSIYMVLIGVSGIVARWSFFSEDKNTLFWDTIESIAWCFSISLFLLVAYLSWE